MYQFKNNSFSEDVCIKNIKKKAASNLTNLNLAQKIMLNWNDYSNYVAIIDEDNKLTYKELDLLVERTSKLLINHQVQRATLIVDRSFELIILLLGAIKAGVTFSLIDPSYPKNRVEDLLERLDPDIVFTNSNYLPNSITQFKSWVDYNDFVDNVLSDDIKIIECSYPNKVVAYATFTTGTTGNPKILHGTENALLHFLSWSNDVFNYSQYQNFTCLSGISHDPFLRDILVPLTHGKTIFLSRNLPDLLMNNALASWLIESKIEVVHVTAPLLRLINTQARSSHEILPNLKLVLSGGDCLYTTDVMLFRSIAPYVRLFNVYGATETPQIAAYYEVKPGEQGRSPDDLIPIGKAAPGFEISLDNKNQLNIHSKNLVKEFEETGIYISGDIGFINSDGNYICSGRNLSFISHNGYRLDIKEIEKVVKKFIPFLSLKLNIYRGQLELFLVMKCDSFQCDESQLKQFMSDFLPKYSVPNSIYIVENKELNLNQKIDFDKTRNRYIKLNDLRNDKCQYIEKIREQLGISIVGNNNFIELGTDSLTLAQLCSMLKTEYHVDATPLDLLCYETINELITSIKNKNKAENASESTAENYKRIPSIISQDQFGLLLENNKNDLGLYNVYTLYELNGDIDFSRLKLKIQKLVSIHDVLRYRIYDDGSFTIKEQPIYSWYELGYFPKISDGQDTIVEFINRPFNLEIDPALRVGLINLEAFNKKIIIFVLPHLLFDGASQLIFERNFIELFNNSDDNLSEIPPLYTDYLSYLDSTLSLTKNINNEYWKNKLDNFPSLQLPYDQFLEDKLTSGENYSFVLNNKITEKIRSECAKNKTTIQSIILTMVFGLFSQYSEAGDVAIGIVFNGRVDKKYNGLLGYAVNTNILRIGIDGNETFLTLLEKVKSELINSYKHQFFPYINIKNHIKSKVNNVIDVMFNYEQMEEIDGHLGDATLSKINIHNGSAKFPITLYVRETSNEIKITIEYSIGMFSQTKIKKLFDNFLNIAETFTNDDSINFLIKKNLSPTEILCYGQWQNTEHKYKEQFEYLYSPFLKNARNSPNKTAVISGENSYTYEELLTASYKIASYLSKLSVKPNELVAVYLPKGIEQVISVLGVTMAGAAYLPISYNEAVDRTESILHQGEVTVILTDSSLSAHVNRGKYRILYVSDIIKSSDEVVQLKPVHKSSDLAYVIFTSGSTGMPKGVMIEHRAALNTIQDINQRFHVNQSDVVYGLSNLNFDLSVYDIFGTLATGATLVLPNEETRKDPSLWIKEINRHKISVWNSVPALMQMLCSYAQTDYIGKLASLRLVLLSGDWIPLQLPNQIWNFCNRFAEVISLGGATEASIWSIFYPIKETDSQWKSIPYGKAMWNQQFHILNDQLEPVHLGDIGELYISGVGLARGYWKDKFRTDHSFITSPRTGEKFYRTGDLGRYYNDGNIEFLGRKDFQIKIRGYRIELGEIESKIEEIQNIERVVVVERNGNLLAYVISKNNLDQNFILSYLKSKLPEYMIPTAIIQLESFPLTENGKVDRNNLPTIQILGQDHFDAPISNIETTLATIWQNVLGLEKISRHANFFEMGGHSLQILAVSHQAREKFGKRIPLRLFFSHPVLYQLAEQISKTHENSNLVVNHYEDQNAYPLTYVQSRLWFLEKLEPNNSAYTITLVYLLKGELDLNWFKLCLDVVVNRHPALRTIILDDARGYQKVLNKSAVELRTLDWSEYQYDTNRLKNSIYKFANQIATKEYFFQTEQLWRPYVINVNKKLNVFIINFHHLVADAMSLDIFLKELSEEYRTVNNLKTKLDSSTKFTYGDYSNSLLEKNNRDLFRKQKQYWIKKLEGFENYRLDLPSDHIRPSEFSFKGRTLSFIVSNELLIKIDQLTKKVGCTRSTLFLAVFHILLYRLSGQSNILTGQIVANRNHSDLDTTIGYFANTTVVKSIFNKEYPFTKYIEKLHVDLIDDFSNQEAPFEMLVETLSPILDRSTSPIFQHMYAYQQVKDNFILNDIQIEKLDFDSDRTKFDLTLYIEDGRNEVLAKIEYYSDLFSEGTIKKFISTYIYLLTDAVEQPHKNINKLMLLPTEDIKRIENWNNTAHIFKDDSKLLFEPFIKIAKDNPDKIAVIADDGKLTYGNLLKSSLGLAKNIRNQNIKPNQSVAIYLPKSLCQVVATLGVMMAGGAYLPISSSEAKERIDCILLQGEVNCVITNSALKTTIDSNKYNVICLDNADLFSSDSANYIDIINKPSDLAYVIFTSGSTGVPKGVMIEHEAALNTIKDINERFNICNNDVVYGLSNLNFDLSVYDIFGTFMAGGTLVLPSDDNIKEPSLWINDIKNYGITIWNSVPALLQMLYDFSSAQSEKISINTLRLIMLSGDWIPVKLPHQIKHFSGEDTEVISLGGATEASIWSIIYPINTFLPEWKSIPYGRPMLNQQFYILSESLEAVPIGTIGELFIGGIGLARGYFNDETRTEISFMTHPESGIRLYKTGDLGRYRDDGLIEFMGRKDHQIKVRGFRIELGEIEAQLESLPEIDRAVVAEKNGVLFAYVISATKIHLDYVFNKLQNKLPEYMIPSAIEQISYIPLTPNGKIDRNALPEICRDELLNYESPSSEIEIKVASIWSKLLQVENISRYDNFFRLGGHSLIALELINKLKSSLGICVSLRTLFQTQNLLAFCAVIEESNSISNLSQEITSDASKPFIDEGVF